MLGSAQVEGPMVAKGAILGGRTWQGQARSLLPGRAIPSAQLLTQTLAHPELLLPGTCWSCWHQTGQAVLGRGNWPD